MISVEIPNDIAEYKPKLIMNLTGRQVALVLITAGCIFLDFKFLKPYVGDTLSLFFAALPACAAACFGWGEKFTPGHIPFEKYLKTVFVQTFVAPKVRKQKTSRATYVPCDKYFQPVADEVLPSDVLECVRYVREHTGAAVAENGGGTQQNAKPPKKYVKSKQAML